MAHNKPKASSGKTGEERPSNLRLNALNSKLTSFQRELFDSFWIYFREHDKWFPTRLVHSQIGTQKVRDALQSIGGDIVRELENQPNDTYELSLIGVLLTSEGEDFRQLLLKYIEFLREQFISRPEKVEFTNKEIQAGLSLSDPQATILGRLIQLGHSFGAASWGKDFWTIRVPKEIEYLPRSVSLDASLDEWLFRHFQHRPVFAEEARSQWNQNNQITPSGLLESPQIVSQPAISSIDALKRRYQAFVSSTYDDLKEERQHVIQALLQTKCIPLGMELFPAASIEQWKLIKRIIDECDYYLVVVAGRYGSLNESQIGYTEMEFDYALSIGKPVLGFYHSNPETLAVAKSEKTDSGRERLRKFTEKVKKRICRSWASSAELGSAVKSAILHELEFNPKPGWVRADAVTSSEQIEKFKQRIADLEERLKTKNFQKPANDDKEQVQLFFEVPYAKGKELKVLDVGIKFTWNELFVLCADLFKSGAWSWDVKREFLRSVTLKVTGAAEGRLGKGVEFSEIKISTDQYEVILHKFVSEKYFKIGKDGWTSSYGAFLSITEKGLVQLSHVKTKQGLRRT